MRVLFMLLILWRSSDAFADSLLSKCKMSPKPSAAQLKDAGELQMQIFKNEFYKFLQKSCGNLPPSCEIKFDDNTTQEKFSFPDGSLYTYSLTRGEMGIDDTQVNLAKAIPEVTAQKLLTLEAQKTKCRLNFKKPQDDKDIKTGKITSRFFCAESVSFGYRKNEGGAVDQLFGNFTD